MQDGHKVTSADVSQQLMKTENHRFENFMAVARNTAPKALPCNWYLRNNHKPDPQSCQTKTSADLCLKVVHNIILKKEQKLTMNIYKSQ